MGITHNILKEYPLHSRTCSCDHLSQVTTSPRRPVYRTYQKFLSQITIFWTSCKQPWPLLKLQVWNFPLFLTSSKQILDNKWNKNWIIRCSNIIISLASTRNWNFSMGRIGFFPWNGFLIDFYFNTASALVHGSWQLPNSNEKNSWPIMV